jgi:hypothetical protein
MKGVGSIVAIMTFFFAIRDVKIERERVQNIFGSLSSHLPPNEILLGDTEKINE